MAIAYVVAPPAAAEAQRTCADGQRAPRCLQAEALWGGARAARLHWLGLGEKGRPMFFGSAPTQGGGLLWRLMFYNLVCIIRDSHEHMSANTGTNEKHNAALNTDATKCFESFLVGVGLVFGGVAHECTSQGWWW